MLLTCGTRGGDFPAKACFACRFKQGRLNSISLGARAWTASRIKRDNSPVVTKDRQ
jgi:hypothetical protein